MLVVSGYFDGTIVRPLEKVPAKKNQKVTITVTDEFISDPVKNNSLRGCLQHYAKPSLRKKRKNCVGKSCIEKTWNTLMQISYSGTFSMMTGKWRTMRNQS